MTADCNAVGSSNACTRGTRLGSPTVLGTLPDGEPNLPAPRLAAAPGEPPGLAWAPALGLVPPWAHRASPGAAAGASEPRSAAASRAAWFRPGAFLPRPVCRQPAGRPSACRRLWPRVGRDPLTPSVRGAAAEWALAAVVAALVSPLAAAARMTSCTGIGAISSGRGIGHSISSSKGSKCNRSEPTGPRSRTHHDRSLPSRRPRPIASSAGTSGPSRGLHRGRACSRRALRRSSA